jgi:hypothetical protein
VAYSRLNCTKKRKKINGYDILVERTDQTPAGAYEVPTSRRKKRRTPWLLDSNIETERGDEVLEVLMVLMASYE